MPIRVLSHVLLWLFVLLARCAWAQTPPPLLPPPPASVCASTTVPTDPGTIHMWPGRWSNPNRAGIGWDFFYGEGEQAMYLTWFVYDLAGRPVWLHGAAKDVQFNSVTGERSWQSTLYKITWNFYGTKFYQPVGSVSVTFPHDTTTRAAVRWSWPAVDAQTHDECLYDRRDPLATTGNAAATLNEAHSSNWFYDSTTESPLNGWGVDLLVSLLHPNGTNQYRETASAAIFDASRDPVWLQSDDDWGASAPPASTFGLAGRGRLRYLRHKAVQGHPATTDCAASDCVYVGYEDNGPDGLSNRFLRNITSGRRGTMSLKALVPATVTGSAEIRWPPPNNATPFPDPLPVFRFDANHIIVDRSVCRVQSPSQTCAFTVAWVSDDQNATVMRVDLKHGGVRTVISTHQDSGEIVEQLSVDDRYQYELSYVSDAAGSGTMRTPEVRVLLDGQVADEIVEPIDCANLSAGCDLGTHDPTVGSLAGEASTDGGAASYSIPIAVPPGRNGMQPELGLVYSSRAGSGLLGVGWSLSGLSSIHRCPKTPQQDGYSEPVRLDSSDRLCLDGQRLVPLSGNAADYGLAGTYYRTEIDNFSRVQQIGTDEGGGRCFRVELKSGRILHYGGIVSGTQCQRTEASAALAGTARNVSWMLAKVEDRTGNSQTFTYQASEVGAGETLLASVQYSDAPGTPGVRSVQFSYEDRPYAAGVAADFSSSYLAGGATYQSKRLATVSTFDGYGSYPVRRYRLSYVSDLSALDYSLASGRSLLSAVTECAYELSGIERCKAPTRFSWTDVPSDFRLHRLAIDEDKSKLPDASLSTTNGAPPRIVRPVGDYDGDGSRELLIDQLGSDGARHYYLAKHSADREISGVLDVTNLASSAGAMFLDDRMAADVDGDGRVDVFGLAAGRLTLNLSRLARGAPLPASPSDLFLTLPTNIAFGPGDTLIALGDVDGDGYVDVLVQRAGATCESAPASSSHALCLYTNVTRAPVTATSMPATYLFSSSGIQVDTLASSESVSDERADLNGDGVEDLFVDVPYQQGATKHARALVSQAGGKTGIAGCQAASAQKFASCDLAVLGLLKDMLQGAGAYSGVDRRWFWLDINGDGLSDLVFATANDQAWHLQLNTGRGFAAAINIAGGQEALKRDRGLQHFRYLGRTPIGDFNSDGRPEVLFPVRFAARMCVRTTYTYNGGQEGLCPQGGGSTPISAPDTGTLTCVVMACPEDPAVGETPPQTSGMVVDDSSTARFFNLPDQVEGLPVLGTYANSWMGVPLNFSGTDTSAYEMAALRFVQTGPGSFRAVTVSLDGSAGGGPTHKVIATLNAAGSRDGAMDLFGDGLSDIVSQLGCRYRPVPTVITNPKTGAVLSVIDNHCHALTNSSIDASILPAGNYGPATLPDGSAVAALAGMASPETSGLRLYINENVGAAERPGSAPVFPELMRRVQDGLGNLTEWDYFPLSSRGQRATGDLPLYRIDGNTEASYVDPRHFYFQSSMPVVASMVQSNGVGDLLGFRSWRYGYREAMYNHLGRGFQGFRSIVQEQLTPRGVPFLRTSTTFHQKFPLTGKAQEVLVGVPSGAEGISAVTQETTDWACNIANRSAPCDTAAGSPPANFPYIVQRVSTSYDLAAAEAGASVPVSRSTVRYFDDSVASASGWDAYGNTVFEQTEVQDLYAGDPRGRFVQSSKTEVRRRYATDASAVSAWWLDKLDAVATTTYPVIYDSSHKPPVDAPSAKQTVVTSHTWFGDGTRLPARVATCIGDVNAAPFTCSAADADRLLSSAVDYRYPTPNYGMPWQIDQSGYVLSDNSNVFAAQHRITQIDYDPANAFYFPRARTVGIAQNQNGVITDAGLFSPESHQPSDGQVVVATSPVGVTTINQYDPFGRLIGTWQYDANSRPLGQPVRFAWNACSQGQCAGVGEGGSNSEGLGLQRYAGYRVTQVQNGSPTQVTWYDRLGRPIKQAKRGFSGTFIVTASEYDAMGRLARSSVPFYLTSASAAVPYQSTFQYDRLGRMTAKLAPGAELDPTHGNVATTYTYAGSRTDITVKATAVSCGSNAGNLCMTMQRYRGVLGMMRTVDAKGGVTRYWYDAAGRAAAIADANTPDTTPLPTGRATVATYNALGQRVTSSDPNQGTWTFRYNSLGELLSQTDARAWTTSVWKRDGLGRVRLTSSESYTSQNTDGSWNATTRRSTQDEWDYDVMTGLLTEVRRCTNPGSSGCTRVAAAAEWQEHYAYDAAGRVTDTSTTTAGWTDITSSLYDANFGREKAVVYPSGLRVQTRYGKYGDVVDQLDADSGARFWGIGAKDAWNNPTLEYYGNGLIGEYTWSASTGQSLQRRWRGGEASDTPVQESITYSYDSFGNLVRQARGMGAPLPDAVETYAYDALQRLLSASTPARTVNYAYDALGNLRRKSDFSADQDAAYDYAAANPADSFCGPNVAKAVTRPGGSQVSFRCDQNGNVLTSSGAGADYPWRSVQYDASNRPVGITSGAYTDWFAYDSNGQRAFEHLRQVDGSNNVLAETVIRRGPRGFEGESTSINVPGSNRTLRHELGDAIVILRTTDSAGGTLNDGRNVEVYYRHTDRLGSPLALSDSTRAFRQTGASATTRRAFDAFGQTRNADFSDRTAPPQVGSLGLAPATRQGFTGHEHLDTLGLIHMNGRVYDYRLGRFLSVDPIIQNPAHSQSLNPYSYIMNNPLAGIDPTGYQSECVVTEGHSCTAMNNDSRSADKLGHTQLSMGSDGKITAHGSDGSTVRDVLGKGDGSNGAVSMSTQGAGGAKNQQAQPSDQMKQSNAPSGNSSSNFIAVNVITPTANERADEIVRKDADTFAGLFLGPLKALADMAIGARDHDSARLADGAAWSMINAVPGGEGVQTLRSVANAELSTIARQNIRVLRGWAESMGWVKKAAEGGPEVWGTRAADGVFSWRLKIKPEAGTREGLEAGSRQPRFDARHGEGDYVNPFTGARGGKDVGTHLPLDQEWWK